jgi:hypothetical protein
MFKNYSKLRLVLGALVVLSPLGLLASGTAFGEWGIDQLQREVGFVPAGLARMAYLWTHAPLSDYGITGFDGSFMQSAAGYILSSVVGVVLVAGIMAIFYKIVKD